MSTFLQSMFGRTALFELGATDEEIAEAVAQAGLTRHWSAILNGMQIDFETFKAEFGGDCASALRQPVGIDPAGPFFSTGADAVPREADI